MVLRKPKGINDRVSVGKITNSSEEIFQVSADRVRNDPYWTKIDDKENFFFTKKDSGYFSNPKIGSKVHVVFNSPSKEYVEAIYTSRWEPIYMKKY